MFAPFWRWMFLPPKTRTVAEDSSPRFSGLCLSSAANTGAGLYVVARGYLSTRWRICTLLILIVQQSYFILTYPKDFHGCRISVVFVLQLTWRSTNKFSFFLAGVDLCCFRNTKTVEPGRRFTLCTLPILLPPGGRCRQLRASTFTETSAAK